MQYDMIISFTSWKKRIFASEFIVVLLSLLKQNTTAKYKVVLVLSTDEFPKQENELPKKLVTINELCDNFEILWTKENIRAYKKYFPTRRKYPDENICIVDDDSLFHSNFVDTMIKYIKENPNKIILGKNPRCKYNDTIAGVRWGGACCPPNSLYDLDETFGRKYFHEHDDEFYYLLAILKGTHYKGIDIRKIADIDKYQQSKKLAITAKMDYGHLKELWEKFRKENPELSKQFDVNKNIKN